MFENLLLARCGHLAIYQTANGFLLFDDSDGSQVMATAIGELTDDYSDLRMAALRYHRDLIVNRAFGDNTNNGE